MSNPYVNPDEYAGTDVDKIDQAIAEAKRRGVPLRLDREYLIAGTVIDSDKLGVPVMPSPYRNGGVRFITPRSRVVSVLGGRDLTPEEGEDVIEYVRSRIRRPMPEPGGSKFQVQFEVDGKWEDLGPIKELVFTPEPEAAYDEHHDVYTDLAEVGYARPRVWPHVLLTAAAFIAGRISR